MLKSDATTEDYEEFKYFVDNYCMLNGQLEIGKVWNVDEKSSNYVTSENLDATANMKMFALLAAMCKENAHVTSKLRLLGQRTGRAAAELLRDTFKVSDTDATQLMMNMLELRIDPADPRKFERAFFTAQRQLVECDLQLVLPPPFLKALMLNALPRGEDFYIAFAHNQTTAPDFKTKAPQALMKEITEAVDARRKATTQPDTKAAYGARSTPNGNPGQQRKHCTHCEKNGKQPKGHTADTCYRLHPELKPPGHDERVAAAAASRTRHKSKKESTHTAGTGNPKKVFNFLAGTLKMGRAANALVNRGTLTGRPNKDISILDPGATVTITNTLDPNRGISDYQAHPKGEEVYVQCGKGLPTRTTGWCRLTQRYRDGPTVSAPALYDPDMMCTLVASGAFLTNSATGKNTGATIQLKEDRAEIILDQDNTITALKQDDGLYHLDY
jgi:hypothetical protein